MNKKKMTEPQARLQTDVLISKSKQSFTCKFVNSEGQSLYCNNWMWLS